MKDQKNIFSKKLDHSQILVRREDLKREVQNYDSSIAMNLLYCIYVGLKHPEYKIRLMTAALQGEHLARLVYRGMSGYRKLPRVMYERQLFLGPCESIEEVQDRLTEDSSESITKKEAERIFAKYIRIKELWMEAITCLHETPFASELAYAAEYVITHKDIPMPEFNKSMFPCNYTKYDYVSGIGREFFCYQTGDF